MAPQGACRGDVLSSLGTEAPVSLPNADESAESRRNRFALPTPATD